MNIIDFINHIENLPRPYKLKWARDIIINGKNISKPLKDNIQKASDLITDANLNNSGSNFLLLNKEL